MSLFFICCFSFLIKKLQKRERTCRAYMKVLEQCFCPLFLLPSPPLFLCYCICPSPSSAACTLCTVVYSLHVLPALLSNCLTHRCNRTQTAFKVNQKPSPITEVASFHGCVYVSLCFFFPSVCWQQWCILFFILFFPFVCFLFCKCLLKIARLDAKHQHNSDKHPFLTFLSLFTCWRIFLLCCNVEFFFMSSPFYIKYSWILHLTQFTDLVKPFFSRTITWAFIPCNVKTVGLVSQGHRF